MQFRLKPPRMHDVPRIPSIEATPSFRWAFHVFGVFVSSSPQVLRIDQGRAGSQTIRSRCWH
jgi:hypothetical protein